MSVAEIRAAEAMPRVLAAVLTFRPQATDRLGLLKDTVNALAAEADAVWVVDNGSGPEEVDAIEAALGFRPYTHDGPVTTCGHGTNLQARLLAGAAQPGDVCVLSDDDMAWRLGWRDRLQAFWSEAPADIVIAGGHIEPEFTWNPISDTIIVGTDAALIRASTGAASWTYRAQDHRIIFPIPEKINGTGDVPASNKLTAAGLRIAQLNLAEHVGQASTWGNLTVERYGWNVAPALARLRGAS